MDHPNCSYDETCSIEFTLMRLGSLDAGQCVKVTARLSNQFPANHVEFRKQLELALEAWFRTEEGADAWENSCEDFNILDLYQEDYEGSSLPAFLNKFGIFDLKIEDLDLVSPDDWHVDTILRDSDKAQEAKCYYCGERCPIDEKHACDGYLGDVDGLYSKEEAVL